MIQVLTIRIGSDNYSYVIPYSNDCSLVVDPGRAEPVLAVLQRRRLQPTHVLYTHGHADHTGGMAELIHRYGCEQVGPRTPLPDDRFSVGSLSVRRIPTPGHTSDSVCYFVTDAEGGVAGLFTGDTLFVAGCGRVFETDMQTMNDSLQKLTALPDETLIYPGHDYTEEDYRFALIVEPDNEHVHRALDSIGRCAGDAPHVPSTLRKEKLTNPFLRAGDVVTFAARRKQKDRF